MVCKTFKLGLDWSLYKTFRLGCWATTGNKTFICLG